MHQMMDDKDVITGREVSVNKSRTNAGTYVVSPESLRSCQADAQLDMTQIAIRPISNRPTTVGLSLREYQIDVGRSERIWPARGEWEEFS